MSIVDHLSNKEITYRYHGKTLRFSLSHALFSSNSIDVGTDLLLKTLSSEIDIDRILSILDVGCGTGTLGIALASVSNATLVGQDRDALAAAFSTENAKINDLSHATFHPSLALENLADQSFDIVVSNIPAKAGHSFIKAFVENAPGYTAPGGSVWVVIVQNLADMVCNAIEAAGFDILTIKDGSDHRVIGYSGTPDDKPVMPWGCYVRQQADFTFGNVDYTLETVYGLPEFDTLSFPTSMALKAASEVKPQGAVLIVDPGQGHLPAWLALSGFSDLSLSCASRDVLQLTAAQRNAGSGEIPSHAICSVEDLGDLFAANTFQAIFALYEPIPGIRRERDFLQSLEAILNTGGFLVVCAKSTYAARLLQEQTHLILQRSRKHKGYRILVYKKP